MIRPTTRADIPELVPMTDETGLFKPMEIQALREVLDDYFATNYQHHHQCITSERDGKVLGFAYYAPASMTDRSWYLYWIVVRKDAQAGGIGSEMLAHVEEGIRQQRGRLLFIETGSLPHYELTRRFYLKNGYEKHALLVDFYAEGDSMVIFRKAIGG